MNNNEAKIIDVKLNITDVISKIAEINKLLSDGINSNIDASSITQYKEQIKLLTSELKNEIQERAKRAKIIDDSVAKEQKAEQQRLKEIDQRAKLIMSVENEDRKRQAMIEKQSQAETIAAQKAEQQAAKKIGYINELRLSVDKLEQEYYQLTKAELDDVNVGGKMLTSLATKRAELQKLQQAYGNYSKNVGNYSSATNGLRLSIGMIAGELPNAGISARIFVMSLSNNIQGLQQALRNARNEYNLAMEAFKNGNGSKPISIFKQLTSAIFSWQTLLMVGVALIVGYWDKIEALGKKMLGTKDATDKLSLSQKAYNKAVQDMNGEAEKRVESITKLGIEIEKYGNKSEYAKKIIDDFNKTFHTHYTTIEQVKNAYPELTKAAIEAAVKIQAANSLIEKSAQATLKKQEADNKLAPYSSKKIEEQEQMLNRLFSAAEKLGINLDDLTTKLTSGENPFSIYGLNANTLRRIDSDLSIFYNNSDNLWFAKYISQQRKAGKQIDLNNKEIQKLLKGVKFEDIFGDDKDKNISERYNKAIIKSFDFEKLMNEAQQKMLQEGVEKDTKALDNELRDREKKIDDYIDDLNQKRDRIKSLVEQEKDPKKQQKMYDDIGAYDFEIKKTEQGRTEFRLQQEKERQSRIKDIQDKWHAKNLSDLSTQKAREYQLILDNHNATIDEEKRYQIEINRIKTEKEAQSESDEIALLRKRLSDIKDINSTEYKDVENLIREHENVKIQIIKSGENNEFKIIQDSNKKKFDDIQETLKTEFSELKTNSIQKAEFNLVEAQKNEQFILQRNANEIAAGKELTEAEILEAKKAAAAVTIAGKDLENARLADWENSINEILGKSSELIQNIHSAETANLEAEKQKQLTIAGNNATEREKIEKDFAQKELDLKKKQANADMDISIAQAVAAGAMGIINIWSKEGVNPVYAGILTALLAGITTANIAQAIAQRNIIRNETLDSSNSVSTSQITEKFATGGTEHPDTPQQADDLLRLTQKAERILTIPQTKAFDGIIASVRSYGGSSEITKGVGVNDYLQESMLIRAFTKSLNNMKAPVISWTEFSNQAQRQRQLENNRFIR